MNQKTNETFLYFCPSFKNEILVEKNWLSQFERNFGQNSQCAGIVSMTWVCINCLNWYVKPDKYTILNSYLLTAQMYFLPSSCTIRKSPVLRSILILVGIVFSEKHISITFILQYCFNWIDSVTNLELRVYEFFNEILCNICYDLFFKCSNWEN